MVYFSPFLYSKGRKKKGSGYMLAERLKELRKKEGLTQEQLAEELNVSRQAIAKWESGKGSPDIENLKNISVYFHVSIDYLVDNALQKESSLKNKFVLAEIFLFIFGIALGIVAENFAFGFVCALLLPGIAVCVEQIVLDYKYKKEGDIVGQRENLSAQLPKNFYGRILNTDPQSRSSRIKYYAIESILFASALTIFEVVGTLFGKDEILTLGILTNQTADTILSCAVSFAIMFCISFVLDTIIYEYKIWKYNRIGK